MKKEIKIEHEVEFSEKMKMATTVLNMMGKLNTEGSITMYVSNLRSRQIVSFTFDELARVQALLLMLGDKETVFEVEVKDE